MHAAGVVLTWLLTARVYLHDLYNLHSRNIKV